MKFTAWQLLAALALMLAAIILSHIFAPGAVAVVVSIVSTVVGTLFMQKRNDNDPPPPPAGPSENPALKLVATLALVLGIGALACGPSFADIEKAAAGGDVSAKLSKCRSEARADFYVGGKSEAEALKTYDACKKREGL